MFSARESFVVSVSGTKPHTSTDAMFLRATTTTTTKSKAVNAHMRVDTIVRSTSARVARAASRASGRLSLRRRRGGETARTETARTEEARTEEAVTDALGDNEAVNEMTRVLETSLSPSAAAIIAKGFVDLGVENPRDLRAVVAKRSLGMIFIELAATAFNALMAGALIVMSFSVARDVPTVASTMVFDYVVEFCVLLAAAIFSIEAVAHLIILGVYVYSTVRFEASDLRKFTKAMRKIGDDEHIIGVVPSIATVQRASSLIHVVTVLNKLRDALVAEAELITPTQKSTLHNLAAYFEYSNAQSKGFVPADYAIDEAEAMRIAHVFSEWDTDASGSLSPEELRKLLGALGSDAVSDLDVNVAMRLLDKDETGEISFNEFVRWFKRGVQLPEQPKNVSKSGDETTESALEDADPNARIDDTPR